MRIDPTLTQSEEVKALLEENLRYVKEIYASTERTRRYIMRAHIFGFIKIILIVGPLILGFLYLQPKVKQVMESYNKFSASEQTGESGGVFDLIKKIGPEIFK